MNLNIVRVLQGIKMTLKDHSAQAIFEALMLDPDLEIGEGQTREEAAKQEAEYRARQHYNNMRALSLGTDDSSIKALLDFVSQPVTFLSHALNIIKASWSEAKSGDAWNALQEEDKNPHGLHLGKKPTWKMTTFLGHIGAKSTAAKKWAQEQFAPAWAAEHPEDPDGWVDALAHGMGTHPDHNPALQQLLSQHGLDANQQQKMSENVLYHNGFGAPSPMPKNPTHDKKMFNDGRYGTNTKDQLEEKADISKLNNALDKMGRKERLTFGTGSVPKLKFDDNTGNVKQWESYKNSPEGNKRVRINHSHISPDAVRYQAITESELGDYTVAEVLRGFFHHRDKDNGAHDVTPEQQAQINATNEENESHLEDYDDALPSSEDLISQNPTNMEEIDDDEFDFVFKSPGVGKYETEKFDKNLPIKLMHHDHDHVKGIAQQYGMADARGYVTPAHVKGIHDAIKAGQLDKGNIIKATSKSTGNPYYVLTNKAKEHLSGLHKYVAFHNGKPLMPIKAAKKLVDKAEENAVSDSDEDVEKVTQEGVQPIPQNEINDALDPGDSLPMPNHPVDAVNHADALDSKLSEAFISMGIAYDPKSIGMMPYNNPYDNASMHGQQVDDAWKEINEMANNPDLPYEALNAANNTIKQFAKNNPQFLTTIASNTDNALFDSFDFQQWDNLTFKEKEHAAHVNNAINASKYLNNLPELKNYAALHNMNLPEAFADKSNQLAESVNAIKAYHVNELGGGSALHPLALVHALEKHDFIGYSPASQAIQNSVGKGESIQDINDIDPIAVAKHANQSHGSPENSNVIEQVMKPEVANHDEAKENLNQAVNDLNDAVEQGDSDKVSQANEALNEAKANHPFPEQMQTTLNDTLSDKAYAHHIGLPGVDLTDSDNDEFDTDDYIEPSEVEPEDDDFTATLEEEEETEPEEEEEEEPETTEEEADVDEEPEPEPEVEDEEEPSQVEEELDTVDDAAEGTDRQKAEVMNELFGRDQDSKEAQKYSKYLDKQKPEKIDSLHEKHVIGNIEKKAMQAKANKVKAKLQEEKDAKKAEEKAEADKVKEEEKAQKEEDKEAQKNADTVPHKASEIEKKIKEGQDPKQMARENMIHQHQNEDLMSDKAKQEHKDAFHKFESSGVDMDELMDEKDEHGESYGSEEHLQSAMDKDAKQQEQADHYDKHLSSTDYEHRKNRENAFRAGQPGKFTEFDEKGNPSKDLHHKLNTFGESSLEEHEHGKGPEAATTHSKTGEDLGDGVAHSEGGQPEEDAPKHGPPDPEVAVKKQAEGYVWHEETRSWILKETMKDLNGSHGPNGATMMHGGSTAGTKPGQMVKPFATNEDGSPSDNHFVVSHAGVHKVTPPSTKPGSFSSNQHTTEASLGHALKDVEPGPNGKTHLGNDALSFGGKLGNTGLGMADNHIAASPKTPSLFGAAINDIGGAMDKLKGMLNLEEIEEQESSVQKLRVKYK